MSPRRYKGIDVRIANEWTMIGALIALAGVVVAVLIALVKGCG